MSELLGERALVQEIHSSRVPLLLQNRHLGLVEAAEHQLLRLPVRVVIIISVLILDVYSRTPHANTVIQARSY